MEERITDAEALGLRPARMDSVEPELAVQPPRPIVWAVREWNHAFGFPDFARWLDRAMREGCRTYMPGTWAAR